MNEKTLIKGEKYGYNIGKIIIAISVILFLFGVMVYGLGDGYGEYFKKWYSFFDVMSDPFSFRSGMLFDLALIILIVGLIVKWWLSSFELTVTNKRVFGIASFGKRVDLPLDSISSVGTSALKGVDIGTSSGRIKFKMVRNQVEVHDVISDLLVGRQHKQKQISDSKSITNDLREIKKLLDDGIITQEEFEQKKQQMLGF